GDFMNSYDLVHLYNATGAKFVFSMMDLEAVTGGCHYPWQCTKYRTDCMDCPALPVSANIRAHNQLMAKVANCAYIDADIFSSALYDLEAAKNSIVPFNKYWHLYYPIDENVFRPPETRSQTEVITLFSNVNHVDDPRKGFNYLLAILLGIDKKTTRKIRFLCLPNRNYRAYDFKNITFEEFPFCKSVNDLVPLYQKTDIFLCCSIEDSSPMMLQEALLCGVPAISFDTGIGRLLIEDGKHGYVVPRYDIKGFEEKLLTMISGKSSTIESPKEIHEHMVAVCGKEVVKSRLKEILGDTE
ncbi:MAG: glycosyltransferase, partial [Treponema sp.]|nr:glycosyltransferase [Treponema sp.]